MIHSFFLSIQLTAFSEKEKYSVFNSSFLISNYHNFLRKHLRAALNHRKIYPT